MRQNFFLERKFPPIIPNRADRRKLSAYYAHLGGSAETFRIFADFGIAVSAQILCTGGVRSSIARDLTDALNFWCDRPAQSTEIETICHDDEISVRLIGLDVQELFCLYSDKFKVSARSSSINPFSPGT